MARGIKGEIKRRERLRACYWEGPSEVPERRSSSSAPRRDSEEGSGPRVLLKSGPGNRGRSACGPTHVARLEFPRETGLILRCAGSPSSLFSSLYNSMNISERPRLWSEHKEVITG